MPRANRASRIALQVVAWLLAVPLAAFFGFVGYMKAFAPVATLAEHHAWTVVLPVWAGRLVGWSEIACALALVAARAWPGRVGLLAWVAGALIVNQIFAALVHVRLGETAALPQNAVLVAMLAVLGLVSRRLAGRGS